MCPGGYFRPFLNVGTWSRQVPTPSKSGVGWPPGTQNITNTLGIDLYRFPIEFNVKIRVFPAVLHKFSIFCRDVGTTASSNPILVGFRSSWLDFDFIFGKSIKFYTKPMVFMTFRQDPRKLRQISIWVGKGPFPPQLIRSASWCFKSFYMKKNRLEKKFI